MIMSAAAESDESNKMQHCASCGIAGVLKDCDYCDLVKYCSDTVRKIIGHNTKKTARSETKFYSDNQKAVIMGTARSVVCRCQLIKNNRV